MARYYDKLTEIQKRAIDWHMNAVLTENASIEKIGHRPIDLRNRQITVVHPDEYRNDLRELFSCDHRDVDELERLYQEYLRSSLNRSTSRGKHQRE